MRSRESLKAESIAEPFFGAGAVLRVVYEFATIGASLGPEKTEKKSSLAISDNLPLRGKEPSRVKKTSSSYEGRIFVKAAIKAALVAEPLLFTSAIL